MIRYKKATKLTLREALEADPVGFAKEISSINKNTKEFGNHNETLYLFFYEAKRYADDDEAFGFWDSDSSELAAKICGMQEYYITTRSFLQKFATDWIEAGIVDCDELDKILRTCPKEEE